MSDCISRQAAIDAAIKADMENHNGILSEKRARVFEEHIAILPSAQPELEDKIRAIGYTGKEGRIYIGGRLFAVRELAQ